MGGAADMVDARADQMAETARLVAETAETADQAIQETTKVTNEAAENNLLPIKHPNFNLKKNTGFHFDAVLTHYLNVNDLSNLSI